MISTFDEPCTMFLVGTRSCNLSTSFYITYRNIVGLEADWFGLFRGVPLVYILATFGLIITEEFGITIQFGVYAK